MNTNNGEVKMTELFESKNLLEITHDNMTMTARYISDHTFIVTVTCLIEGTENPVYMSKSIPATYTPVYGIDVADMYAIEQTGEELAQMIESNYEFIMEEEDEG